MNYKARKSTESFLGIYLFSFILFYYHNTNELAFIHTRANFQLKQKESSFTVQGSHLHFLFSFFLSFLIHFYSSAFTSTDWHKVGNVIDEQPKKQTP